MTWVKICGLMEPALAVGAAEAGADYIGLILAPSRRRVTPEQAKEIVNAVKQTGGRPQTVGVFVNETAETVNRLAVEIGLDRVQISGDEDDAYCQRISAPLIRVVHVKPGQTAADVAARVAAGAEALAGKDVLWLLDTGGTGAYGGSGRTFDRRAAFDAARDARVIVAGGLTPADVATIVREVRPFGVDVSSGVETDGVKDMAKIKAFIEAVRQADAT
jgi:phosphoribosylanthranilate isomerase